MKTNKYIFPAVLFFLSAVAISLMIPFGGRYLQRFNLGDRWKAETLTAPFDFSILKSDEERAEDLAHAERNYIPVYTFDAEVLPAVLESQEAMDSLAETPLYRSALERALTFIYNKGICTHIEHALTNEAGESYIRIDKNGTLETLSTKEIFTPATAADYLNRQLAGYVHTSPTDWRNLIRSNLTYSQSFNTSLREREFQNISRTKGIVYENELIVAHNQVIDQSVFNKLNSLKNEYRVRLGAGNGFWGSAVGHTMIVFILMTITFLFLFYFRNDFIASKRSVLFMLIIYLVMVGLCSVVYRSDSLNVYLIPFAIVPIYILTFFDVRMSVYEMTTILLLCSLVVPKPLEFLMINFVASIIGIFVLGRAYRRERVFLATAIIFLSNCVCYIAMTLIQTGGLTSINYWMLVWFVVNAILFLGMYQLIYVFEKLFGFVSDITLLELSDTNQKLLLELAHKAPGTFQHTLQVANLSEAAAKEIGARALLARTGALYHDIGKMLNPAYFTENTTGGYSPHDSLSPVESADIIKKHVTDGVALAKKQRLPSVIIDFITGHHADGVIYYFYAKQKELDGQAPDLARFSYSGAKPISKEASICMMADSVEAASRSLPEYSEALISALVEKIIDTQMREGLLNDSELSFHDITRVKEVFKEYLGNIYHTRISYPERETVSGEDPAPQVQ